MSLDRKKPENKKRCRIAQESASEDESNEEQSDEKSEERNKQLDYLY